MFGPREVKTSRVIQAQLRLASDLLFEPSRYEEKVWSMVDFQNDLHLAELTGDMVLLENLAKKHGCESGFWRYLKKVADTLGDGEKSNQYEIEFHRALRQKDQV